MRPMYPAKAIILLLVLFTLVGCAQSPPRSRHVELHLPLPAASTTRPAAEATKNNPPQAARKAVVKQAPANLWERMRAGFQLSDYLPDTLTGQLGWYRQRQYHMDRVVEQSAPYLYFILEQVEKRGMPSEIALLPVVESGYHPFAYSRSGAAGIWQFIPSTGKHYGLKQNPWYDGRRDIYASTRAALDFLQELYERLNHDWLLAIAAYNSGGTTVERAVRAAQRRGKSGDFWSIRPLLPEETRSYIPKLLALSAMVMDPDYYGITLKPIPNEPHLTRLHLDERINLTVAARLAELPLEEFRQLNAGFTGVVTPREGPHDLVLPIDRAARFKWRLAQLSTAERIGWIYHTVAAGENLGTIARRYDTTVAALMRNNALRSSTIHPGERLRIDIADAVPAPVGTSAQRQPAVNFTTHTVADGDTLWKLARRYRVTIAQLAKWNAIQAGSPLMPGQKLVVRRPNNT